MRLATLVDAGLGMKVPAQSAVGLSIVAFVGKDGADAGHHGEGAQEQPLEDERVITQWSVI